MNKQNKFFQYKYKIKKITFGVLIGLRGIIVKLLSDIFKIFELDKKVPF